MNYYNFHIGDYRRDTAHLSLLEHGVYRQLLDMYYLSETKIPEETEVVYRRLCARTDEEKKAVNAVLSEFFVMENGWIQARCDKVILEYKSKSERARINGKLGGRPIKTNEVISGIPKETKEKANHKPITNNQELNKPIKKTKNTIPEDFGISEAVKDWASKNGHSRLAERLAHFIGYAKSSGKAYVDWDQAFMNAIRDDWAKLGKAVPSESGWDAETKRRAFTWKMSGLPMEEFHP